MKVKMIRKTPQQQMTYVLRRCALELHHDGEFARLADEMGVSPSTLSRWCRNGFMPRTKARWLERRFGTLVPVDRITRRR
jgi:transcriptional regulator with XRE-family HTH domain